MLLALAVVLAQLPSPGATSRTLTCGPGPSSPSRLIAWEVRELDGGVVLVRREGTLPGKGPRPKGKPAPGCPSLPAETAAWRWGGAERWVRSNDRWRGPQRRVATLTCEAVTLSAAKEPDSLVHKAGKECPEDDAFELQPAARVDVAAQRCVLAWKGGAETLVFGGLEAVTSADDCYTGADWRVVGGEHGD